MSLNLNLKGMSLGDTAAAQFAAAGLGGNVNSPSWPDADDMECEEEGGRLSVDDHAERTADALQNANNVTVEKRALLLARAKTAGARQTKVIKSLRLKKETAGVKKKALSQKSAGYKRALEARGFMDAATFAGVKLYEIHL